MKANQEIYKVWLLPALIFLAVAVGMFWDTLSGLYQQWMTNEDYSTLQGDKKKDLEKTEAAFREIRRVREDARVI